MCGVGAVLMCDGAVSARALQAMVDALAHRGPDGRGTWISDDGRVGLAHTRLAVQDLSDRAAQPMRSQCGRYLLSFNGEIYNHEALRAGLDVDWRTSGDAETLLERLIHDGEACLERLNGMFAFAFVDLDHEHVLFARDHFGQKPLYLVERDRVVAAASEVRALVEAGFSSGAPSSAGLASLAAKGSIACPLTHVDDVRMLPPGSWMRVHFDGRREGPTEFWRMPWRRAIVHYEHAVDAVAGALVRAAERSIVSDVPVAVFLSGGVDSAALVALLQHVGAEDLVAYTVGLPGDALDESERARMSAERLGVKHVVIDISDDDGRRFLNESREQQDVPSIDGANTYIIARCVRDAGVKVAVSGVGADEMFGGYPSFDDVARFKLLLSAPFRPLGRAASLLPSDLGSKRVSRVVRSLSSGFDSYALFAARRSLDDGYVARLGLELELEDDVAHEAYDHLRDLRRRGALPDGSELQRALHLEQRFYLHDQLLRDTDQFGMASALEIRAPFLDLEVAKVISGIDPRFFRKRSFKGLLIDAVERATNTKLRDLVLAQPKRGFTLPVERWARA